MLSTHSYSKEELVAEIGSAFLCHHTGIDGVIENQAAYCQSWLSALKDDRSFILKAAREADKAFRMIAGEQG
jgi:antirestriction protein ArdC